MLAHTGTSVYASRLTVRSICDKISKTVQQPKYIYEMAQSAERSLWDLKKIVLFALKFEHF